jgi:hypothetical protein
MDPTNVTEKILQFTPTPVRHQPDLSHEGIHTLSCMPRPLLGPDRHVVFQDMRRITTIISDSGSRAISSEEEFSLSGIEDSDDEDSAPVSTAAPARTTTPPTYVAGPVGSKHSSRLNDAHVFFKIDGDDPSCYMCEFCECVFPITMNIYY